MLGNGLNCGKQKSCPLQAKALLWIGTSPSALASFSSTDLFFPLAWLPLAPSVVRCGRNDCSARVEQWFGAGRTTEGVKGTWGVVLSHPLEEPDSTSEEPSPSGRGSPSFWTRKPVFRSMSPVLFKVRFMWDYFWNRVKDGFRHQKGGFELERTHSSQRYGHFWRKTFISLVVRRINSTFAVSKH